MPELPEVETTRRGIEPQVTGFRVKKLTVREPRLRWPVPAELAAMEGRTVRAVTRRGKYLLLDTTAGTALIHLGMSGSLRLSRPDEALKKHDHVSLLMSSGYELRLHDPRRFGCWLWLTGEALAHPLLAALGPEPLSEDFTDDHLFTLSRRRTAPVKAFIMDSHVVVGVGNIYANEALFAAGIHPLREAGRVSQERYRQLTAEIRSILSHAIGRGGTTLRDFVSGHGDPGYFQLELNAYGRAGQPCKHCATPLKEIRPGGRSTVYCPRCQR
jgi:formamidopyrimidine-DNA glycosylase